MDASVVYTLGLAAAALAPAIWFQAWTGVLLVLAVTGGTIIAELFNTALEVLYGFV